jgi:hypothetical protein
MIFSQRRKLLKITAAMPLAVFLSPLRTSEKSGFDEFLQEIAQDEKLLMVIGKNMQGTSLQRSAIELRQQLLSKSSCLDVDDKLAVQKTFLAIVKDDFRNNRIANYQGWILSQTEVDICQLAYLS